MPAVAIATTAAIVASTAAMRAEHESHCMVLQNGDKYCKEVGESAEGAGWLILILVVWTLLIAFTANMTDSLGCVAFVFFAPIIIFAISLIVHG